MNRDVRMRGFAHRTPVGDVVDWIEQLELPQRTETIELAAAHHRVLKEDIVSTVNVPGFRRSMMDGFAVHAADLQGADNYNPIELSVVGQVYPGQSCGRGIGTGEAVQVMTGAEVPDSADAVVPVEHAQIDSATRVQILSPIAPSKNIGRIGEDIAQGDTVLNAGRKLRPQDVGLLSSIGRSDVPVYQRPRVRIVVTGNELLSAGTMPQGVQIVDSNSVMLQGLVERDGGLPIFPGILPDDPEQILDAFHSDCDIILVAGGSSTGKEDYAPTLIAEHGELAIHGVAMRPSSPAGVGRIDDKPVFLLPGNPVSCLCAYDFFARIAIRKIGGLSSDWPYKQVRLPLVSKISSALGRTDYARVQIVNEQVEPIAISGASILSSTIKASGFCIVPAESEGYGSGTEVTVFCYD